MKINFTDVPDVQGFDPVPKGTYIVTVVKGSEEISGDDAKHPGTPYFKWDLQVSEGEYQGKHIFTNTSVHPDALQYGLKPLLKAVGEYNPDPEGNINIAIADVVNKTLGVYVTIKKSEEYDDQNNVRSFMTEEDARDKMAKQGSTSNSLLPG